METTGIVFRNASGDPVTTSYLVADTFGKEHRHVVRDIDLLLLKVQDVDSQCCPNLAEAKDMFVEVIESVPQPNGGIKGLKSYIMNRDGFTLLAMGYTGKKAMEFKLKYIAAFNAMEQKLQQSTPQLPPVVEQMMQQQMQMTQQIMTLCSGLMQRMDRLEQQPKPVPVTLRPGVVYTMSDSKWRKFVMNVCDVRIYYPHFLKVAQVSDILRQRGLPVYQPTLYQWLRDKGYLRTEHRAYNRPSADCEKRGWMVSTWSGSQKGKHPGRQNFVPYINPVFIDTIEQEMRAESKLNREAIQLALPLGKEVQP